MKMKSLIACLSLSGVIFLAGCGESVKSVDFLKQNEKELTAITMECMAKKARGENILDNQQCINASKAIDEKNAEKKQSRAVEAKNIEEQREKKKKEEAEKRQIENEAITAYMSDPEKMLSGLKNCYAANSINSDECKIISSAMNKVMLAGKHTDYTPTQKSAYDEAWVLIKAHVKKNK